MSPSPQDLRVAVVASSLGLGGAEKQTVYMIRALREAGFDARLFYLGGGGHYETVLRQTGVPIHPIDFPDRPWVILVRLIDALRRFRPHIVQVCQFGDLHYGGIAGRLGRALVLAGVRSDGWYELRTHGRLSRFLVPLAHGLVSNSHYARQNLMSQGVAPRKMEVLPNVIDPRDFDDRAALPLPFSLPAGRTLVAAVGNLHACKRFDRFVEALALARRSEPSLAGVLAGTDRGTKTALQERATALGLGPQDIVFLGACHRVPSLLARVAMLILTSDYEGFPNVILEAMAARLPVITTPAGDAGRVVQQGKTGYVVDREDTQSMAACMIRLAQSPALRGTLGEAGRKRVEQEYNYDFLSDRLVAIYRRFADREGKAALIEMLGDGVPVGRIEADSGSGFPAKAAFPRVGGTSYTSP